MKFIYNYDKKIGYVLNKYNIVFKDGDPVEVSDQLLASKLLQSPYLSEFVDENGEKVNPEEAKPKRKYKKREKKEDKEIETQAETETEATPEVENASD